jgi:hypothetical protein
MRNSLRCRPFRFGEKAPGARKRNAGKGVGNGSLRIAVKPPAAAVSLPLRVRQ